MNGVLSKLDDLVILMNNKQKALNALYEYEINHRVWLFKIGFHETYDIAWFWTIDEKFRKI